MRRLEVGGVKLSEFLPNERISMKYKITFRWETTETNIGDIVVEADSEEEALKSAQEIYENGDIGEYILDTMPECDDFSILEVSKVERK